MSDEQAVLWEELNDSPEHKLIMRLAKKLKKIRDERKEALTESKEKEDKIQEDLAKAMHAAEVLCFEHDGYQVKIKPHSEKVVVKQIADDEGGDSEDAEDD